MAASVAAAASSSSHAYADAPLSIRYGQTISQPSVVAFMLELMDPRSGDVILDIGSGSGWTTALLAECVQPDGRILGLEIVPELVTFGREHIAHACCTACYHSTGTKRVNRPS